jgi:hypothetical protein
MFFSDWPTDLCCLGYKRPMGLTLSWQKRQQIIMEETLIWSKYMSSCIQMKDRTITINWKIYKATIRHQLELSNSHHIHMHGQHRNNLIPCLYLSQEMRYFKQNYHISKISLTYLKCKWDRWYKNEMSQINQRPTLYSTVKISSQITQPFGRN